MGYLGISLMKAGSLDERGRLLRGSSPWLRSSRYTGFDVKRIAGVCVYLTTSCVTGFETKKENALQRGCMSVERMWTSDPRVYTRCLRAEPQSRADWLATVSSE